MLSLILSPYASLGPPRVGHSFYQKEAIIPKKKNIGESSSEQALVDLGFRPGFIDSLVEVFSGVFNVLRPKKYCAVNVMDLRKQDQFFPIHCDLAKRLENIGFIFDDILIWDRRDDYNNLRSLGYPYVFRINKIHEFILIFKKPGS